MKSWDLLTTDLSETVVSPSVNISKSWLSNNMSHSNGNSLNDFLLLLKERNRLRFLDFLFRDITQSELSFVVVPFSVKKSLLVEKHSEVIRNGNLLNRVPEAKTNRSQLPLSVFLNILVHFSLRLDKISICWSALNILNLEFGQFPIFLQIYKSLISLLDKIVIIEPPLIDSTIISDRISYPIADSHPLSNSLQLMLRPPSILLRVYDVHSLLTG